MEIHRLLIQKMTFHIEKKMDNTFEQIKKRVHTISIKKKKKQSKYNLEFNLLITNRTRFCTAGFRNINGRSSVIHVSTIIKPKHLLKN